MSNTPLILRRRRYGGNSLYAFVQSIPADFTAGDDIGIVSRGGNGGFYVWQGIGDYWYRAIRYDDDGTNRVSGRFSKLKRVCSVYPSQDFTVTGAASVLNNRTASTDVRYVGGQTRRYLGTSTYIEVDVTGAGDLYVVYTGRTSGGYASVLIDGAETLVELAAIGTGAKGFDTYNATDLKGRQVVKIASGLPSATYTVRVTRMDEGSGSSSGTEVCIEAVMITCAVGGTKWRPPEWQQSTAYEIGQEVRYNGVFYVADATGTSGVVGPSHTTGTGSDGALNWRAQDESSYNPIQMNLDYASEKEYAFTATITAEDLIGGQTHGAETVTSSAIYVDGVAFDPATDDMDTGAVIDIREFVTVVHTNDANMGTIIFDRSLYPNRIDYHARLIFATASVDITNLYVGMMPIIRNEEAYYDTEVFDTVKISNGKNVSLDVYDGAGVNVSFNDSFGAYATASADTKVGYTLSIESPLILAIVSDYSGDILVNPNANDETNPPTSADWQAKAYLRILDAGTFSTGDVLTWSSSEFIGFGT